MWKRSRTKTNRWRKESAFIMLFAVLMPLVQLVFSSIDQHRNVVATDSTVLVDNDKVKVSVGNELVADEVAWTFRLEQKQSIETQRQLKIQLKSGETKYPLEQLQSTTVLENWQNGSEDDQDWLITKEFTGEQTDQELKITLPYEVSQQLSIQVQMDEQTIIPTSSPSESLANTQPANAQVPVEKKLTQNVLTAKDSGPYQLTDLVPERQETEAEVETPAETETPDTEESTESEAAEDPDPETEAEVDTEESSEAETAGTLANDTLPRLDGQTEGRNLIIADNVYANLQINAGGRMYTKDNPTETHDANRAYAPTDNPYNGVNNLNTMYQNFRSLGAGGKAKSLIYGAQTFASQDGHTLMNGAVKETIELDYDKVGYYDSGTEDNPSLKSVGARVEITNITVGPQPSWGGRDNVPYIEFSNNLFSGVLYGFIKKMDIEFTFYDTDSQAVIRFTEGNDANISFASLNAYRGVHTSQNGGALPEDQWGTNPGVDLEHAFEFAGFLADKTDIGVTSTGTLLKHNSLSASADYANGTYYAERADERDKIGDTERIPDFTDKLGGETYHKAAVAFPIVGSTHSFKFGSTWGRAWNTFASSSSTPVKQNMPTKTVQPINEYMAGDEWDSPSGADTIFKHRYYNDLDVMNPWELPTSARVEGHDIDDPENLAPGVPTFEKRYVEKDKNYYYFINQETIHIGGQSLVVPSKYMIDDKLPKGVELDGGLAGIVVYDLFGKEIGNALSEQSSITGNNLKLVLSESATKTINDQSKVEIDYGKDFSIRLLIKVNGEAEEMVNQASTTFEYASEEESFQVATNNVKIRLGEPDPETTDIEFTKVDEGKGILPDVEFKIFNTDEDGEQIGEAIHTVYSGTDGVVRFEGLSPGVYIVSESKALNGYSAYADFEVTIADNLTVTGLPENEEVVNKRKPFELNLIKKDSQSGQVLEGAEFTLTEDAGDGSTTQILTTDEKGNILFAGLDWRKIYRITETKAPDNYRESDIIYQLEYDQKNDTWKVSQVLANGDLDLIEKGTSGELKISAELTVENDPFMPLPQTGGSGRMMFWIISGILLVIASGYFIWRQRQVKGVE